MEERIAALERRLEDAERGLENARRRARLGGLAALLSLLALSCVLAAPVAQAQGFGSARLLGLIQALTVRVASLEAKTAPITVSGADLFITGRNVHIRDGSGSTDSGMFSGGPGSGLGNLIIGYNLARGAGTGQSPDARTGAHNLVLGDNNNYTSYAGIVAGVRNAAGGPYASVTGGRGNTASGDSASVGGGQFNVAGGVAASVNGGNGNTASGEAASVSGGSQNVASANRASVSGGQVNRASGQFTSVSGGAGNVASGNSASISGGGDNTASGTGASVGGGFKNAASGLDATVSGGANRAATGSDDWRAGTLLQDF